MKFYLQLVCFAMAAVLLSCTGDMPASEPDFPFDVYLVMYNANNGVGSMEADDVKPGQSTVVAENQFVREGYDFVAWNTKADGSGDAYYPGDKLTPNNHMYLYAQWTLSPASSMHEGHFYVDLGLPSGTLWAANNIGAEHPEQVGNLYTFDATIAAQEWGGKWRLPSKEEVDELLDDKLCQWTIMIQSGVKGYVVTSKQNGNALFLPHTGYLQNSQVINTDFCGLYWTQTSYVSDTSRAFCLRFNDDVKESYLNYVTYGFAVRPVWTLKEM